MHEPHLSSFKPFSPVENGPPDFCKPHGSTPDASQKDSFLKNQVNNKNNHKNEKIESEMKKIGFHFNSKAIDKNLFVIFFLF